MPGIADGPSARVPTLARMPEFKTGERARLASDDTPVEVIGWTDPDDGIEVAARMRDAVRVLYLAGPSEGQAGKHLPEELRPA